MKRIVPLFSAAALLCSAAPLCAQARFPLMPGALVVASSPDGTSLSIDSVSLSRIGDDTYDLIAIYQYGQDLARQNGFEQMLEMEQVDCAGNRVRHVAKHVYHNAFERPIADRDSTAGTWMAAGDQELPLLKAICGTLQRSFAASLPLEYGLAEVQRQPSIANPDDVRRSITAAYPRLLHDAGVTGMATLYMRVRPDGRVDHVRVVATTQDAFSEAAMRVADAMRFTPAEKDGHPVAVWVTLPVTFTMVGNGNVRVVVPGSPADALAPAPGEPARTPRRPGQSATTCSVPVPACGATP
ncbi:MAG: energy transducer TonB [Gemmatimonadetes bacterium]|nr:energy transducer TonB [Gemmatimonadota bacterium]